MMGGSRPNARQKRWLTHVKHLPCMVCGNHASAHHCVGTTGKHKKVPIGHDWILPLCWHHHQSPQGIHGDLSSFIEMMQEEPPGMPITRKHIEKKLFAQLVEQEQDNPDLPDELVIKTIGIYHG